MIDEMSDDQIAKMGFALDYLEKLPTLSTGQADDLKIDRPTVRVWLSRCGYKDGEPFAHKVTVERLSEGRWVEDRVYRATGQRPRKTRRS